MPSPFPGIDPFIESQLWQDFHAALINMMREMLMPRLRPRYVAQIERNVTIEEPIENGLSRVVRPDLTVADRGGAHSSGGGTATGIATEELTTPILAELPEIEDEGQSYLSIRETDSLRVVTVIELLSPENKRTGSRGRGSYEGKRRALSSTGVNLVEIDLLRGGERLHLVEFPPQGDFYVNVYRAGRKLAEIYAWKLPQPLPKIAVPLAEGDADAPLDLQAAANAVYDRAGYDYALRYGQAVEPPLSAEERAWCETTLKLRDQIPTTQT